MDVNEKIVNEWLQVCKRHFTLEDVKYKVYGKKGGSNYSNIDLLSWDGTRYYDYEVKWRSKYIIPNTAAGLEELGRWTERINSGLRLKKIKEITQGVASVHLLVLNREMFVSSLFSTVENKLKKQEIGVLWFDAIVEELFEKTETKGKVDTEISQIIRLLKYTKVAVTNVLEKRVHESPS